MRHDIKKVLTERARTRGAYSYHKFRYRESRDDHESLPTHQGMRRPYILNHGDAKETSYLYGPLKRFLHGCIGRRWDDVWSEICAKIDDTSVSGQDLRHHIGWEVTSSCGLIDGEVWDTSYGTPTRHLSGLYVHPVDGILRDAGERKRHRRNTRVELDGISYRRSDGILVGNDGIARKIIQHGKNEAVRIAGIWYAVTFADARTDIVLRRHPGMYGGVSIANKDIVTGKEVRRGRYRAGKRQMNAVELRRLGLVNDTSESAAD